MYDHTVGCRIVKTSNQDKDWYNEEFVNLPPMAELKAILIANTINTCLGDRHPDYYKVVTATYKLYKGIQL